MPGSRIVFVAPEPLGRGFRFDLDLGLDFFGFGFDGPGFANRGFTLRSVIVVGPYV